MSKCQSATKASDGKKQCGKYPTEGSQYCNLHQGANYVPFIPGYEIDFGSQSPRPIEAQSKAQSSKSPRPIEAQLKAQSSKSPRPIEAQSKAQSSKSEPFEELGVKSQLSDIALNEPPLPLPPKHFKRDKQNNLLLTLIKSHHLKTENRKEKKNSKKLLIPNGLMDILAPLPNFYRAFILKYKPQNLKGLRTSLICLS